ncbi:MAG TPA: hypothetical protein VK864_00380 [Longimicrobiales bacterium]|nr:hypothetical protein [Longimicrobiales bacterium]
MKALTEFLFPAPAQRRALAIWQWWEARRLGYNLTLAASGTFALVVMRIVTWLPPNPQEMPPLVLIVVFGVLANLCYLLGPLIEIAVGMLWGRKMLPAGPTLFRMGLTFSVGLTLLPILIVWFDWLVRIAKAVFGAGFV